MERINFKELKKWQKKFQKQKLYSESSSAKKFYCLEMFLTPLVEFIWDMYVTILLVM